MKTKFKLSEAKIRFLSQINIKIYKQLRKYWTKVIRAAKKVITKKYFINLKIIFGCIKMLSGKINYKFFLIKSFFFHNVSV